MNECPKCGEEMVDACDECEQKACSLCGCPQCDQSMPALQEVEDDEL